MFFVSPSSTASTYGVFHRSVLYTTKDPLQATRFTRHRGHTGASEGSGASLRAAALSQRRRDEVDAQEEAPRAERLQLDERGADDGGDAGVGQGAARPKGARDREDAQV